jgi:hydrogenase/urease accessory protein HupE
MSRGYRWVLLGWMLLALVRPVAADEFRPAYLQLHQVDDTRYDVLWKVPALDESVVFKVAPLFPAGAQATTPVKSIYAGGAVVRRWRMEIEGGLSGKTIEFSNPSGSRLDVLVRLERADGSAQLGRVLLPLEPGFLVTASPGAFEIIRTYTALGIEHILTGFDHLLFVLALVLLVQGARRLVATVTAFTLAHSLTLAAATLGWMEVAGPPVEAAIALSIVFVAAEIVRSRQGRPGLTQRYPWVVAFVFGLLHGLGFASALAEVGLPQLAVPTALLFFNVGVELGQLVFIAVVLAIIAAGRGWGAAALVSRRLGCGEFRRTSSAAVQAIGCWSDWRLSRGTI